MATEEYPGSFPTNTPFYIKAVHSGLVLQPLMELRKEYCRIIQAKQLFGQEGRHQLWRHQDGYLVNEGSGLALDYEGGNFKRFGTISVCQWPLKTGADAHNQKWIAREGGLIASYDDYSRVLDVKGESTLIGAEILLYKLKKNMGDGAEGDNQRFVFELPSEDCTICRAGSSVAPTEAPGSDP